MLFASRSLLRLNKSRPVPMLFNGRFASYSSAAADEYHSLNDQLLYEVQNPVAFQGDKAAVFDATATKERRFIPFELKELTFKCSMGAMGVMVYDYMYHLEWVTELGAAAFALNWMYKSITIMSSTMRKIEVHRDGKTVTVTPRVGNPWDVKISEVRKLKHEKELVQTFEESYLFPVEISGKKWYLHGNGQESIRHGEAFRAVINGQSLKF